MHRSSHTLSAGQTAVRSLFGLLFVCLAQCSSAPESPELALHSFDAIVTKSVLTAALERTVDLRFGARDETDRRIYEGEYVFSRARDEQHYICAVVVARSGMLLDPTWHAEAQSVLERESSDEAKRRLKTDFPRIGLRAARRIGGIGPGGASENVTFTTSDGRFDIMVAVSSLLPDGIADPRLDLDNVAQEISRRYDANAQR